MAVTLDSSAPRRSIRLIILPLLLLVGSCGVNTIPTLEERVNAAWSEVLNQYQRRSDLVPNLVETVKGYAKHEEQVLEAVAQARSRVAQMQLPANITENPEAFQKFQESQQALTGALGRLIAVAESNPDLKANQNFLALQSQLEGTENRIAVARRDYIEAVRAYNTELRTFPGALWAAIFFRSNKPMAEFAANENAQTAPTVKF